MNGKGLRQLLGIRGGDVAEELPTWRYHVQLTKPLTWVILMLAVLLGVFASGNFTLSVPALAKLAGLLLLTGPCLTGFTQCINDIIDREADAINEPYRPIPSGKVSLNAAISQALILLSAGFFIALILDCTSWSRVPFVTLLTALGTVATIVYSCPPLRLKTNGLLGPLTIAVSYLPLPWFLGFFVFHGTLTAPVLAVPTAYVLLGYGTSIINDFKSIEGDKAMGFKTLPILFGLQGAVAATMTCLTLGQLVLCGVWWQAESLWIDGYFLSLLLGSLYLQLTVLRNDPINRDVEFLSKNGFILALGLIGSTVFICLG